MNTVLIVITIIVCVLLALVILIQSSKGGISSGFSSINQIAGVRASSDIEKITWGLVIGLFVLCIVSTATLKSSQGDEAVLESEVANYNNENVGGSAPATAPATQTPGITAPGMQQQPAQPVQPAAEPQPVQK